VLWLLSIGIALTAAILMGLLVRCLFSWRNFKRLLLGLACLAGLIVLFYAEEDFRGRLAWGQFKAQWEAKGEKFDLAALDFVADYQKAMRAENAFQAAETDFLRQHPHWFGDMSFFAVGEDRSLPVQLMPSGWFYQNQLRSSKFILEQFLSIGDMRQQTISPTLAKQADEALRTMRVAPYSTLCKIILPGLVNSPRKFAWAQAAVNLARTACALERYRLAHGKYPETLDVLAPQSIAKVPHDPIGGQPLHYRSMNDGQFILYSVGWNEKDDGGIVSLDKEGSVDLDQGDWVWRYPDSPKP
jgi:hypothetical protein